MNAGEYSRILLPMGVTISALGAYYVWGPSRGGVAIGGYWPGAIGLLLLLLWEFYCLYAGPVGVKLFSSPTWRLLVSAAIALGLVAVTTFLLLFVVLNIRGG